MRSVISGTCCDCIINRANLQETLDDLEDLKLTSKPSNAASSTRKKGRKISAKCWMAQKFPMSLRQLLPVMDVIGHANKHLGRMAKFLRKYGEMDLFPVKLQVSSFQYAASLAKYVTVNMLSSIVLQV